MVQAFSAVKLLLAQLQSRLFLLSRRNPRSDHPFLFMPNQPAPETELLRAAYAAFNARDIDAALVLMAPDVEWPRAFKGGFVQGPEAIRAY